MPNKVILAVDDSPVALENLKNFLDGEPYDLHCVSSGAEALEFLKTNPVDLILLDIEMPELNGYQTAAKIQEMGVVSPIVYISTHTEEEYIDEAINAGGVGLLPKACTKEFLLETISEFTE